MPRRAKFILLMSLYAAGMSLQSTGPVVALPAPGGIAVLGMSVLLERRRLAMPHAVTR